MKKNRMCIQCLPRGYLFFPIRILSVFAFIIMMLMWVFKAEANEMAQSAVLRTIKSGAIEPGMRSSLGQGSINQELAEATPTKTTTILGLYRYPRGETELNDPLGHGIKMDSGLAIRSDEAIVAWWWIVPPMDNIEETWHHELFNPDGSLRGELTWRYFIRTVNGEEEYCFESSSPGSFTRTYCETDRGLIWIIGMSFKPSSGAPLGFYTFTYTHNGVFQRSDRFLLADLEMLNPNPAGTSFLLNQNGEVTTDINKIASADFASYEAQFAVADGVTPLVLRAGSIQSAPVTFRLVGDIESSGSLSSLDGTQGPSLSVQPALVQTSTQDYFTAAVYTVPAEFYDTSVYKEIELQVSFSVPNQQGPAVISRKIILIRPPLILIHGMWSNPSVWSRLISIPEIASFRRLGYVDWSPAETHLAQNTGSVSSTIRNGLQKLRGLKVAATQADIVAHSAGGQLARLWAQDPGYRRIDNLMKGDYHKLITIGTPHDGSELATLVQRLVATNSFAVNLLRIYCDVMNKSLTRGVVADQEPNSEVLSSMQPTPVKSHVWIGYAPVLPAISNELLLWRRLGAICKNSQTVQYCQGIRGSEDAELLRSRVFNNQPNDGVVSNASQAGGIQPSAQSVLSNTVHTEEVNSGDLISQLPSFLDSQYGFDNAGFP